MASLYPSLEDMQVDQMAKAELCVGGGAGYPSVVAGGGANTLPYPVHLAIPTAPAPQQHYSAVYPSLTDYMGLELTDQLVADIEQQQKQLAVHSQSSVVAGVSSTHAYGLVAPLSAGVLQKSAISHAIREVTLCKDKAGRVGLRCQEINKGIFVVLVQKDSPASMAGLRFGDQILQINGETVAGYSMDKVHSVFRKVSGDIIKVAVRDRPFERTVTMHKDSAGVAGFQYTNGKIVSLVKDSSAARNGLLVEHNLLEINGQNVVGVKDNEVRAVIEQCGQVLTITVMPSFIYDHMMKRVNQNLIKKMMDHSIPDL